MLEDLAALDAARGDPVLAARLLAAAQVLREEIGTVIAPCESRPAPADAPTRRAALGDAEFAAAWRPGKWPPVADLQADSPPADLPSCPARRPDPGTRLARPCYCDTQARPAPRRRPRAGRALRLSRSAAATVYRADVAITAAQWGYAKPRELLFLLATSPPLTRDQIGLALWPDSSRDQLGNALHTALRELRKALGDSDWVRYSDGRYTFSTYANTTATWRLRAALAAARRARPASAALPDLQRAIAAYGGDFLAGLAAGEWAQTRRDELRRSLRVRPARGRPPLRRRRPPPGRRRGVPPRDRARSR